MLSLLPTSLLLKFGKVILKLEKPKTMECPICKHGKTYQGTVTFTLERGDMTIIFKNVPAQVCDNCGDFYLSTEITKQLLETAMQIQHTGSEVEIINWKLVA